MCTSVNEVICHGIPDKRKLVDGDIINIDVTLYLGGFHGDLNETYYVGDKARADPDAVRVVEASRDCLDEAIKLVKPGMLFRDLGNVIEKVAKPRKCSVVKTYCGHVGVFLMLRAICYAFTDFEVQTTTGNQPTFPLQPERPTLCQEQSGRCGEARNVLYHRADGLAGYTQGQNLAR